MVSQSHVGCLVLAASPSALPRGQNKSVADANSQAQKLEGKNNHPVNDCLLMESINLWPKKSQLICGEWCLEKINNLDTCIISPYWCHAFILGKLQHLHGKQKILSIHHVQRQQLRLKFVLSNLDQRHKAYQNLQSFRNTVTFSTIQGVRGENFQGDCSTTTERGTLLLLRT